jgi:hypothetical protein
MGINNPVEGSSQVTGILSQGWETKLGGKIEFVEEPQEMLERILTHIDRKRAALGLPVYDPAKFGRSGDARMQALMDLEPEARAAALYGTPAAD